MLLDDRQDKEAAFRWHTPNSIRRESIGSKQKLMKYFRDNVGLPSPERN
jgi:hypothetical protein